MICTDVQRPERKYTQMSHIWAINSEFSSILFDSRL